MLVKKPQVVQNEAVKVISGVFPTTPRKSPAHHLLNIFPFDLRQPAPHADRLSRFKYLAKSPIDLNKSIRVGAAQRDGIDAHVNDRSDHRSILPYNVTFKVLAAAPGEHGRS